MRRNLNLVGAMQKAGIDFVPMPVLAGDDKMQLGKAAQARIDLIEASIEKQNPDTSVARHKVLDNIICQAADDSFLGLIK